MKRLKERRGTRLAHFTALSGQLAADILFHDIQDADAFECLKRGSGALGRIYVEEFAARVSPACRLDQWFLHPIVQAVESPIGIGLQNPTEGLQMSSGPLALAIREYRNHTAGGSVLPEGRSSRT